MSKTIISANELNGILKNKNTVVIDCRFYLTDKNKGKNDYLKEHIPTAHYAHLDNDLSGEIIKGETGRHPLPEINNFIKKCSEWGIDENTQVVVYDQGHGGIAARLWFMLKWLGHERVAVLNGGWKYWKDKDCPISNELPLVSKKEFIAKENKGLIVPLAQLEELYTDGAFQLVDSRSADRYRGENEIIDPVAGHIPNAISMPFLENIGEDGLFKNREELKKRFEPLLEERKPENCIFYCGSGVTACHNLLVLSYIGKEGALLYPGSWSEWIVGGKRPIEARK